ncbi:MAG: recombinase family protein [Bacteroidales bacterium]|nr:recombinase family protein [Bacteroidales bacterium]
MGKDKIIYIFSLIIFVAACDKSNDNDTQCDCGMVKYEYEIDNKHISFCLPSHFSDTIERQKGNPQFCDNLLIEQSKLVFYSAKDRNAYFCLYIENPSKSFWNRPNKPDTNTWLDTTVKYMITNAAYAYMGTTLTEKRLDKNNHSYYLIFDSHRKWERPIIDSCFDEFELCKSSDSIDYSFTYLTYFGWSKYMFSIYSIENIYDFSYGEKRKILESIRIW